MSQNKFVKLKDITSLEQIAPYHDQLVKYTNGIVNRGRNTDIVEDIVQDAYIKLHRVLAKGTVIDGGYIIRTLKNLYLDHYSDVIKNDNGSEAYTPFIHDRIDDIDEVLESEYYIEGLQKEMDERISTLTLYERNMLLYCNKMSMKAFSRKSGITYRTIIYAMQKINEKIGIEPTHGNAKRFKDERLKNN